MFQFPGFPPHELCIHSWVIGFPHSDIHGYKRLLGSSPWLFAANHVLLRLLVPRHSPLALCSLRTQMLVFVVQLSKIDASAKHADPKAGMYLSR